MTDPDMIFQNHGTLWLIFRETDEGDAWAHNNIGEPWTMWGDGIVVEHRMVYPIIEGAKADGLVVAVTR